MSLEDAAGLLLGVPAGAGVGVDRLGAGFAAQLGDGHPVKHRVDAPVAAGVVAVADRLAGYLVYFALTAAVITFIITRDPPPGLSPEGLRVMALFTVCLILWVTSLLLVAVFGEPPDQEIREEIESETSIVALAGYVGITCLVAPVAEEVFFRGFVFGLYRRRQILRPKPLHLGNAWQATPGSLLPPPNIAAQPASNVI